MPRKHILVKKYSEIDFFDMLYFKMYPHTFQKLWGRRAPGEADERRDSTILKSKKKVRSRKMNHKTVTSSEGSFQVGTKP